MRLKTFLLVCLLGYFHPKVLLGAGCSFPLIDNAVVYNVATVGVTWLHGGISLPNGTSILRDPAGTIHVLYIQPAADGNETSVVEAVSTNEGAAWTVLNVSTSNTSFLTSPMQQYVDPKIIRDLNNTLHALWSRLTFGAGVFGDDFVEILHSTRNLSGSWATPIRIATMSATPDATAPLAVSAAVDSSATVHMVYGNDLFDNGSGGGEKLWYIYRSSAGIWSTPSLLWDNLTSGGSEPPVAALVDNQDQFHVILASTSLAIKTWSGGSWSGWTTLWPDLAPWSISVKEVAAVVDNLGKLHVLVMGRFDANVDSTDLIYLTNSGGAWQIGGQWFNPHRPYQANIAVDNQGKVHLIWAGQAKFPGPFDTDYNRVYATDNVGGNWTPIQEIRVRGWDLYAATFGLNVSQSAVDVAVLNRKVSTLISDSKLAYFKLPTVLSTYLSDLLPPSGLAVTPLDGGKMRLEWLPTASTATIDQYAVYWDSGTGTLDYTLLLATVSASATQYITQSLPVGYNYFFGLRAVNSACFEETNSFLRASAVAVTVTTGIKAAIKVPQSGRKVGGNRVTVMAEIVQGDPSSVKQVEFQYRSAVSTTAPWISIVAANQNHPNPDTVSPYFTHWDVTGIAAGDYELRAVAADLSDNADQSPPTITVTVDNTNPDTEEKVIGTVLQKREVVFNSISNTVKVGDQNTNSVTEVTLPSGSASGSSTTLKIVLNPAGTPSAPANLSASGQVREITLENGQTSLASPASLTFQYQDSDSDGLVDDTTARADKLLIYAYDTVSGRWKNESASFVDTSRKTVITQTTHFSLFGLFSPAATDLSDILIYPVPWVPNDGIADNGKPYNSADPDSGIIFDNITQSAKIQIFTVTGELVWEKTTDTSSGKVQWDGKNDSGRNAASGGYFAVIADTATGSKVTRKIAIIR